MGHMLLTTRCRTCWCAAPACRAGTPAAGCHGPRVDATEAKVVAMLHEKGNRRKRRSREKFLEYAWEWKEKYGGMISTVAQAGRLVRRLGADQPRWTGRTERHQSLLPTIPARKGRIYRSGMPHGELDKLQENGALWTKEVVFGESHGKLYYLLQDRRHGQGDHRRHDAPRNHSGRHGAVRVNPTTRATPPAGRCARHRAMVNRSIR